MTGVSEFPAIEQAARIIDRLDPHRRRQVIAFAAERYGFSLQPSPKPITATPSGGNRSEFAAIEDIADLLDGMTAAQLNQALAVFAARFHASVAASYKPPSKARAPSRKRSY